MTTSPPIRITETKAVYARSKDAPPAPARASVLAPGDGAPAPALPLAPATLSDGMLALLLAALHREDEERAERKREAAIASLRERVEQAKLLGVSDARLAAALALTPAPKAARKARAEGVTDGRSVVKPLYWNPDDHSQTWTGRGKAPPWIAFSSEMLPPRKPGGKPRKVPLPKFHIPEGAV